MLTDTFAASPLTAPPPPAGSAAIDWQADLPPGTPAHQRLATRGYAVLPAAELAALCATTPAELAPLTPYWDDLPPDAHLRDGGRYRHRRHGSFVLHEPATDAPRLEQVPHRAHWQPTTYNALHGGLLRWFEPVQPALVAQPGWGALLSGLGRVFAQAKPVARWFIEAHPFRIDTEGGVGRPTPEGAHRDGVDFVAVILVARQRIRGGETRVFDAQGPLGVRFTLAEPWSALLLDDERVIHESTPIQPADAADAAGGHRDTLVLTFRAAGFMDPPGGDRAAG